MVRAFDHVVFLSKRKDNDRFYDRKLVEKLDYKSFSVIPNGADFSEISGSSDNFRREYGIKTKWVLLCVGSFMWLKDEKMILKSFLRSKVNNSTIVFIGNRKTAYTKMLENIWRKAEKDPSVHVLFLENVPRSLVLSAYETADIYLLGSKSECFPLVILEAMASKTPFISTDVGCVPDLPGGLIVRSTEEMAQGIRHLMKNPHESERLGKEGQRACVERYSWDKIVADYGQLFENLA